MNVQVYESRYKDLKSICIESERLTVTILPEEGSKIQSIFDKERQKELLYQTIGERYRKSSYGMLFEDGEFSGFDEMFPTISECFYPSGPWRGITVPDHGEVWAIPWAYTTENSSVTLSVYGVRFPYKLEKKIEFLRENCIRLSYKVTNLSSFDFDFIWAAHPLFNCSEDMVIVLPLAVKSIINTVPTETLGDFGAMHTWPITQKPNGETYDMTRISPKSAEKYEKYYVLGKMQEGWCALHDTKSREVLALSYPVDKVPYLGLWINEGGYSGQYNAALEPCTGALDRLDTAKQWNQAAVVKGRSEYDWYMNLTVDSADSISGVDQNGYIRA